MILASYFYLDLVRLMRTVELETSGPVAPVTARRSTRSSARMDAGAFVARRDLTTISGSSVSVPDPERYVHLQFRRFAGCPICDLHLRSFARRHEELVRAGVQEVVVFHSPVAELKIHASDLPFALIADPEKRLYAEFGVGMSARSLLDPRVWGAVVRGVSLRLFEMLLGPKSAPALRIIGGRLGLPADFLIASDGAVVASKYGTYAYDQWSVDQLLKLVLEKNPVSREATERKIVNTPANIHRELRQRILQLPGVTERQNAGIHEDAFFVGGTMFMHIHGHGHCDIRLSKADQERVLAEGRASPHRWAPDAGYVTFVVAEDKDLEPVMELVRISHRHFALKRSSAPAQPKHFHSPAGVAE